MMPRRVAWVTGGSRNIGLAITERLVSDGYAVAVNGLDVDEVLHVCRRLTASGADVIGVPGDISVESGVREMIAQIHRKWGRLDVLVNNAAAPLLARGALSDIDVATMDRSFRVNVGGVMLCSREAAPLLTGGAIVNLSSVGATRAHAQSLIYDAGKAAVESMTRGLAIDLAPQRIRVNGVAPGAIENDRFRALSKDERRERISGVLLGRVGTGEDIAAGVSFLASADASYITGQVLTIDGGLTAQARPAAMTNTRSNT
ncbi:SDR family oxidoreductase [Microbacterium esteraromaticum]|uniref:SDR family oxidoreductase n=1 Tax=Microbacterium esteraromaticum TaxID=57043 RepID=A0A7D8AIE8_9MICO|nr:SDR family oxidoreductase [Microbacterium esteraromaticum]QMU96466.1 SDR family oxidoreductase [Microbacterium esteraromaticum]